MTKKLLSFVLGAFVLSGCQADYVPVSKESAAAPAKKVTERRAPVKKAKPAIGVKATGTCQGLTKNSKARMSCCIEEAYECFGYEKNETLDHFAESYVDACAKGGKDFAMMRKHCG